MYRTRLLLVICLVILLAGWAAPQALFATDWEKMPGQALDVGAGADGSLFIVGTDQIGYRWNADRKAWETLGQGKNIVAIDGDANGDPWFINSNGQIYRWNRTTENLQAVPGRAKDIGCGNDGSVFVVSPDGSLYRWNLAKADWEAFRGISDVDKVDVAGDGSPIVVKKNKEIWFYTQASKGWVKVDGSGTDITAGLTEIMVTGPNAVPLQWLGGMQGNVWATLDGGIDRLSLGTDGTLLANNKDRAIYRRKIDWKLLRMFVGADKFLPFIPFPSKGGLMCGYADDFSVIWKSAGLGARKNLVIKRPEVPEGWAFVGDTVGFDNTSAFEYTVLVVQDAPGSDLLASPVEYQMIWSDRKDGNSLNKSCKHVALWKPIPPDGYVAMGMVATLDYKNPMDDKTCAKLRCVKADQVARGGFSEPIWNDQGTGANPPLSLFCVKRVGGDENNFPPGTFLAANYNNNPVGQASDYQLLQTAPNNEGYLIGFTGEYAKVIGSMLPVYRSFSDSSREFNGTGVGQGKGDGNSARGGGRYTLKAKPGYAVNAIIGNAGAALDGFRIKFSKVSGYGMDPKDSYESPWAGGSGGNRFQLGGYNCLFQGIHTFSGYHLDSLNLVPIPQMEPWVIKGLTPQEIHDLALPLIQQILLDKEMAGISDKALAEFLKGIPEKQQNLTEPVRTPDITIASAPLSAEDLYIYEQMAGDSMEDQIAILIIQGTLEELANDLAKLPDLSDKLEDFVVAELKKIGITNPKFAELKDNKLSLNANWKIKLSEKVQAQTAVKIEVDVSTSEIAMSVTFPGDWRNALGFPGLNIKNLCIDGKMSPKAKPLFTLNGAVDTGLPASLQISGEFSPADASGVHGITAKIDQVTLKQLMLIPAFLGAAPPELPDLQIKGLTLTIANLTDKARGWEARRIRLNGTLVVLPGLAEALFESWISPKGIYASALIPEFELFGMTVTGEGLDGRLDTADDGAGFVLNCRRDAGGNQWLEDICRITARVKAYGTFLSAEGKLRGEKVTGRAIGRLAGLLDVVIEGESMLAQLVKGGEVSLKFRVQQSCLTEIQNQVFDKLPYLGPVLSGFSGKVFNLLSIESKGATIAKMARGVIPAMDISISVFGKGIIPPIPYPETTVGQYKNFGTGFVDFIKDKVWGNLRDQVLKIADIMKNIGITIGKETAAKAVEVAKNVKAIAEESAREITRVANLIGNFSQSAAADVGRAVMEGFTKIGNFFRKLWPF